MKVDVWAHAPKGEPLSFRIMNAETGEIIVKGHKSRVTGDELSDLLYEALNGEQER